VLEVRSALVPAHAVYGNEFKANEAETDLNAHLHDVSLLGPVEGAQWQGRQGQGTREPTLGGGHGD
jgi:hypothetical protein